MANNVEIGFKTVADTKGAEKAEKAIDKVKEKVKETKKEASETEKTLDGMNQKTGQVAESMGSLGSAISIINPQIGGMISMAGTLTNGLKGVAVALKAIVTNPIAIVIMAAVATFALFTKGAEKLRDSIKKANEQLSKLRDNNIASINRDITKSYNELARAIENTTDKLAHLREMEDAREGNRRRLSDAQTEYNKQIELNGATTPEQKQTIEDKYALQAIAENKRRGIADAKRDAERAYSSKDASMYSAQRDNNNEAIRNREGIVELLRKEIKDLQVVSNDTRLKEDERQAFKDKLPVVRAKLAEELEKIRQLENENMKLTREEAQAKEKRAAILESISAIEEEAMAQEQAILNQQKQREEEARKLQEERVRGVNEVIRDSAEADDDAEWQRAYDKADSETKKQMQQKRLDMASLDESNAKDAMSYWLGKNHDDPEVQRQLEEAKREYQEAGNRRRAAEDALVGLNEEPKGMGGLKASDRIQAMGGFATAGAAAATGIGIQSDAMKQFSETKKQTDVLRKIEQNTRFGKTAVFS